jgi:hypothetical protein
LRFTIHVSSAAQARANAKSHFQKGGANLPVCLESPQRFPTFSEMTFGNQYSVNRNRGTSTALTVESKALFIRLGMYRA